MSLKLGDTVEVSEDAIGYCHPTIDSEYTHRITFHGKPEGKVVKTPDTDDGSYCFIVQIPVFEHFWGFKRSALTFISSEE